MIRVLIVTTRFVHGGIEKFLLDVFENTPPEDEIRYELLALTSERDDQLVAKMKSLGVRYYSLEMDKHSKIGRSIYHYSALYKFLKKHHYDVVHYNITSYGKSIDLLVVMMAGIKKRIIHSHSAYINKPLLHRIRKPLRKLYDVVATDYCACSDEAARYLFSKRIIKKKAYTVIINGLRVNDTAYQEEGRRQVRNELGISDDIRVIGHVGRLTEPKNHEFLIDVFARVLDKDKNNVLILIGEGKLEEEIRKQIKRYGIEKNVMMLGSKDNIRDYLSAFDVFVFPSKYEGLGIAVVEAQCNGLPCFVSDGVPTKAVVTENVKVLCLRSGADAWADEILKDKRNRKDERQKVIDSGYDISNSVRRLERIYKSKT